jgi:hypothetical protein
VRIYLNQKTGEESRRQEIQDGTEGRRFRQSPGLSDTNTLMVRGVAAMPSRIARVVYVGREKDALNSSQPVNLRCTSCSSKRAARTNCGLRKLGWICGGLRRAPGGLSPKGEAPSPSILETSHFSERYLQYPLYSPDVQRGGPDEATIFNRITHSSFRGLCRCKPLIFIF